MNQPRLVLDANVIVSGFLFGGGPARLLALALDGSVACFISLPILDEVREVLLRPKFGLTPEQVLILTKELHELCQVVSPQQQVKAIAADPDDNAILECAWCARADLIVSGDAHLLALQRWRDIPILNPANALAWLNG